MQFYLHSRFQKNQTIFNSVVSPDNIRKVNISHDYVISAAIRASPQNGNVGLRRLTIDPDIFFSHYTAIPSDIDVKTVSIIIVAHNEHEYGDKTVESIYNETPGHLLNEIIIVDDASNPPMNKTIDVNKYPNTWIYRQDNREGLIRSKVFGARLAKPNNIIIFLDAHVRPDKYWLQGILRGIAANPKRVVVPLIPKLSEDWVIDRNAVGFKMMFDWSLEFHWFDDGVPEVPCMSGGLYGVDREWFLRSGEYDLGMLQWGGENIEHSIRLWLCGGEIHVARESLVAHVFRPSSPYVVEIEQIKMNQLRAVVAWFNDVSIQKYLSTKPSMKPKLRQVVEALRDDVDPNSVLSTRMVDGKQCGNFEDYTRMFRNIFVFKGLISTPGYILVVPPPVGVSSQELARLREAPHCLASSITSSKHAYLTTAKCPVSVETETGTPTKSTAISQSQIKNDVFVLPFMSLSKGRQIGISGQHNDKHRALLCLTAPRFSRSDSETFAESTNDYQSGVIELTHCNEANVQQEVDLISVFDADTYRTQPSAQWEPAIGFFFRIGSLCVTHIRMGLFALRSCTTKTLNQHQLFTSHAWVDFTTYREIHLKSRQEGKKPYFPTTIVKTRSSWSSYIDLDKISKESEEIERQNIASHGLLGSEDDSEAQGAAEGSSSTSTASLANENEAGEEMLNDEV